MVALAEAVLVQLVALEQGLVDQVQVVMVVLDLLHQSLAQA
jgi:hypothetical protein